MSLYMTKNPGLSLGIQGKKDRLHLYEVERQIFVYKGFKKIEVVMVTNQ